MEVKHKTEKISIEEASLRFPGVRFCPTGEELVGYYLRKKLEGLDKCVDIIGELDICENEPWDLPAKSIIGSEDEWFFFTPKGKRYPNGPQTKRATKSGHWKATGKYRNVKSGSKIIGKKRTLVFHMRRLPKKQPTEWIVHEFSLNDKSQDVMALCRLRRIHKFFINDDSKGKTALPLINQIDIDDRMRCNSMEDSGSNDTHSIESPGVVDDEISLDSSSHQEVQTIMFF